MHRQRECLDNAERPCRSGPMKIHIEFICAAVLVCLFTGAAGCRDETSDSRETAGPARQEATRQPANPIGREPTTIPSSRPHLARNYRVVHVFVPLCDNRNQGIVPVPASLGNGQDAAGNLYWGAMYGVKTFFRKRQEWKSLKCIPTRERSEILETIAFHRGNTYVIAQAYNGAMMKAALADFFGAAAGRYRQRFIVTDTAGDIEMEAGSDSDLICFAGHNGLMDNAIEFPSNLSSGAHPEFAIVLACKSDRYFSSRLFEAGCKPLITTSGLMAPEAYTLEAIIRAWSDGGTGDSIHQAAAEAYSEYQKCSLTAAKRLFVVRTQP